MYVVCLAPNFNVTQRWIHHHENAEFGGFAQKYGGMTPVGLPIAGVHIGVFFAYPAHGRMICKKRRQVKTLHLLQVYCTDNRRIVQRKVDTQC